MKIPSYNLSGKRLYGKGFVREKSCLGNVYNQLYSALIKKIKTFLWSPYVIGQTIIFSSCFFFFFFLSSFFFLA